MKAAQQLNVSHGHYWRVPIASAGLAFAEVTVMVSVVRNGMATVVPIAIGGTLGCWSAMLAYREIARRRDAP